MQAILVSVDYGDLLALTLPYNRHHFREVVVVTTPEDKETQQIANANNCLVYATTAFYDDGAVFNKWKALEAGLNLLDLSDWLCIMDADVLWPRHIPFWEKNIGNLYTPRRRIMADITKRLPQEPYWRGFPMTQPNEEFAGYSQIFHGTDPHLGARPWHEINWRHAGGADTMFQRKWPEVVKVRPPFEVLHLGPPHTNWCGRASIRVDGTLPSEAAERAEMMKRFSRSRFGKKGEDRYREEKL